MARAPDVKYAEAKALYDKGLKLVEIANQLSIPDGTVRRWKSTHKWDTERSDKKNERSHKRGAPKGNKYAKGNKGGAAPKKNKNAETHGLFTKWLPEETQKIMGELTSISPLDLLWNNIILQIAAIIRAQNIMHVTEKEEMIKEIKKEQAYTDNGGNDVISTDYVFQFAWDRQATFMNAQSRAYTTLNSMLKQYDEMLHKNWDLATEEQKARIAALKKQSEDKEPTKDINVKLEGDIEGWGE